MTGHPVLFSQSLFPTLHYPSNPSLHYLSNPSLHYLSNPSLFRLEWHAQPYLIHSGRHSRHSENVYCSLPWHSTFALLNSINLALHAHFPFIQPKLQLASSTLHMYTPVRSPLIHFSTRLFRHCPAGHCAHACLSLNASNP